MTTNNEDGASALEQLVGEGKKFKDLESLAKGKMESDDFISKLIGEIREMRQELDKKATTEELVDRLASVKSSYNDQEQTAVNRDSENPSNVQIPRDNVLDVKKQVAEILEQDRKQRAAEANVSYVRKELETLWGSDHIPEKLSLKAKELGVSNEYLASLAETQPKVLLALIASKENQQAPNSNIPKTKVNTNSLISNTNNSGHKTYSYYQKMRKENKSQYFRAETQVEMHKAAQALGDSFYD